VAPTSLEHPYDLLGDLEPAALRLLARSWTEQGIVMKLPR
jgi:hypothetical protein